MHTTKPSRLTWPLVLALTLLMQGCGALSTRPSPPPPVALECPKVQPLSEAAKPLQLSEPPLESAARDAQKWQSNLRKASGAISGVKPSTKQPKR